MKHTLTDKKEYEVDLLPKNTFDELEKKFPCIERPSLYGRTYNTNSTYKFRAYDVYMIGTKRILSTRSKEVQKFLDTL